MTTRSGSSTISTARAAWLAALLAALLALAAAVPARAGTFVGELAAGPLGGLSTLHGIDIAPDGSGAIVYLVNEGGVDRVVVSRLADGVWQRPERLDEGQAGPSSQPVVAAADGGRLSVAWVNGGNVYAVTKRSATEAWGPIQTLWGGGGASSPHVDLSVNRKGYLTFVAPGAGGHDVRVAYSRDGQPWQLIGAPIDVNAGNDAGVGAGRPRIGASADGIGVVTWGEAGRVWARRIQQLRPSVVAADAGAELTIEGVAPVALDSPVVGVQDDDSFTGIAFRAVFPVDGVERQRVVYRRLRGSRFESGVAVDATPFASGQGSTGPAISNGGVGQGMVIASNDATHVTYALLLRADVNPTTVVQVDSGPLSVAPTAAVVAAATPLKMLVAWQLATAEGHTEVRGRFYNGTELEPEQVLSVPELGPVRAERGIAAAGDDQGNIVVAFVQEPPGQPPVVAVATIDQPPGRFAPKAQRRPWQRTDRPVLSWTRPREGWGLRFAVAVDGAPAGETAGTRLRLPRPIGQGEHRWQVTASDRRGQQTAARTAVVRVDTVAPRARLRLPATARPGAPVRAAVAASDPAPAGARGVRTSGVADVVLDWGDRSRRERVRTAAEHVYARAGRYVVRLVVVDRAGNRTVVRRVVRVTARRGSGGGRAARA